MRWNPHKYMMKGMKFLVSHPSAGLFWDPGLGKTSTSYGAFKILRREGMAHKMLVVSPLRPATSTWPREAEKWDDFRDLNVHVLHGEHKLELLKQPHDVTIINPEGLGWLFGQEKIIDEKPVWFPGVARASDWDILVVDESPKFKHTTSQRFKIIKRHLPKFHRRWILTGDPAPNGLMDLFGQMYILDFGRSLGEYITRFRDRYFDETGFGGYSYVIKAGAEKKIYKAIKPYVLRLAAEDYLDMPELSIPDPIEIDLNKKARRIYDQMENLLLAEVEEGIVTAANAAAATSKCRQIANGGLYLDSEGGFENIHDQKTEATIDLVDELGGKPAFIAYEFKHDLARLRKAFPKAPWVGGGVSPSRTRAIEDQWNAGMIPVLLAQPQSVAHGLNLQGTSAAVIFYSLPWDLEVYHQFIKRIWRQGQKEMVRVYRLAVKDSVDWAVIRALARKEKTQQALFAALREETRARRAA